MRWNIVGAVIALGIASGGPSFGQPVTGCWHYSDDSVFSTVCINNNTTGSFNLDYAVEDPQQGIVKGSCNGMLEVQSIEEARLVFTVPFQEDACRQEDQIFRLAQRDYSCARENGRLVCDLIVFYEDGRVFGEAVGLEYTR